MKLSIKRTTFGAAPQASRISRALRGLAAFATGAHAQSRRDVVAASSMRASNTWNHASADGGATRLVSGGKNTSRWGLRGVEDLGGGLKAVFQLESGINIANGQFDDGPGAIFDRRATIGLKNRFGQITLGRNFTTTYDYMLQFDPMGYAPNYSWATSSTATGGRKDGLFSRSANAVRYDGNFAGFKFGAMYGFGNVPGSMKSSSKYDFGLGYENGPFAAVVTFDRQNGANDSVTPADTTNYIQGIHAGELRLRPGQGNGRLSQLSAHLPHGHADAAQRHVLDRRSIRSDAVLLAVRRCLSSGHQERERRRPDALFAARPVRVVQAHGAVSRGWVCDGEAWQRRQPVARS